MTAPTEYELLTYRGRQACESRELGSGYCGSCPLEGHVAQMRDPESWVHSSKADWYEAGIEPYRSTLRLLSRFAVFMYLQAATNLEQGTWLDLGFSYEAARTGARRLVLTWALEHGLLRLSWPDGGGR